VLLKSGVTTTSGAASVLKKAGVLRTVPATGCLLRTLVRSVTTTSMLWRVVERPVQVTAVLQRLGAPKTASAGAVLRGKLVALQTSVILKRPNVVVGLAASAHCMPQPVTRVRVVGAHCAKQLTGVSRSCVASAVCAYQITTVPCPVTASSSLSKAGETLGLLTSAVLTQSPVQKPKEIFPSFAARGSRR